MLATHQTVHKRNVSVVSSHGWQTVWLRTCYDPDLASKYEEMKQRSEVPGSGVPEDKVLGPCLLQLRRRQRGLMASSVSPRPWHHGLRWHY